MIHKMNYLFEQYLAHSDNRLATFGLDSLANTINQHKQARPYNIEIKITHP